MMRREYRIKTAKTALKAREEAKTLAALLECDVEVWEVNLYMSGEQNRLAYTVAPDGAVKYSYYPSV